MYRPLLFTWAVGLLACGFAACGDDDPVSSNPSRPDASMVGDARVDASPAPERDARAPDERDARVAEERDAARAEPDASREPDALDAGDEPRDAAVDAAHDDERTDASVGDAATPDSGAAGAAGSGSSTLPEGCPVPAPTMCPDPMPRYADVAPIINQRCVTCHNGQNGEWSLGSYQHVADWFGEIRARMINCSMPPLDSGQTMTIDERLAILRWIRCGFPR